MIIRNLRTFRNEANRRLLLLQFYLFSILHCSSVFSEQPFTFDPFTLKIYNLPDSSTVNPMIPYAVACPAQTEPEITMNEEESMDHKALFIRKQYSLGVLPSNYVTCKKKFEMAALFNHKNGVVEFGYEIYFEEEMAPEEVYTSEYGDYGPISEARSVWKQIANYLVARPSYPSFGIGYFGIISDDALEFTWISRITLQYSITEWSLISTKYSIHRNVAKELTIKCDNYDLGHRFYKRKHRPLEKFYSPDEQKKIFSVVKLPEMPENSVCKRTGECVRKYDFLKPYHFRTSYGSPVSCSNLTTIPIWYEVAEKLLNNLEIFLFALGQVTENHLIILPGVYNTLSFMTNDR